MTIRFNPMTDSTKNFRCSSAVTRELTAHPRYYIFLVVILVAMSALGSFVNDMYSPALPSMTRYFRCSVPLAQMGLAMGMVGLALGQLLLGPLSDRYGRRPVLFGSVTLFTVAAVVSIFSPSIHVFNICRIFQGLGAAGGYFLARTIPADIYTGRDLARLMALIGAINGIAPASAPVIGGVTSDAFGWKGVFIVLALFAVAVILLSSGMKESLPPSGRATGDWWKAFGGYRTLLKNKPFMIHVGLKGTALGLLFAYISSAPFVVQEHYGFSQTQYGLLIGFNAIFVAAGSMAALKFRPLKRSIGVASVFLCVGMAVECVALFTAHNLWLYDACMLVALFGLGMIFTASNTLAMNEGSERAGEASSVVGISGYVVGAVVTPLVGLGNVLHATAIVFAVLTVAITAFAVAAVRLKADLEIPAGPASAK